MAAASPWWGEEERADLKEFDRRAANVALILPRSLEARAAFLTRLMLRATEEPPVHESYEGAHAFAVGVVLERHQVLSVPDYIVERVASEAKNGALAFFYILWITSMRACMAQHKSLALADFSTVKAGPNVPDYNLRGVQRLGEGAFGCVLSVTRDRQRFALKVQALVPQGTSLSEARVAAKHEIGLMQLVQTSAVEVCRSTPFVPRILGAYITEESDNPLARAVVRMCTRLIAADLQRGMVVTELSLYNIGDINGTRANALSTEAQRRAWAFQILHGLVGMHISAGLVHQDIKPENVLVSERPRNAPPTHLVIGASAPLFKRDEVWTTVQATDTSPTEAVLTDFGLSISARAPKFGFDGEFYEDQLLDQQHTNGTAEYLDPVLGVYFDATLSEAGIKERFSKDHRQRGLAGDVWATGLVLLNLWMQDSTVIPRPRGATKWDLSKVIGVVDDSTDFTAFRKEVVGHVRLRGEDLDHMNSTINRSIEPSSRAPSGRSSNTPPPPGTQKDTTYMRTFLHSVLLYRAFHKRFPTVESQDTGPYWRFIKDNETKLLKAATQWSGKPPGTTNITVYDYIAEQLRTHQPEVHDFVSECLEWDPKKRVDFFLSDEAIAHTMFTDTLGGASHLAWQKDKSRPPKDAYLLDVATMRS